MLAPLNHATIELFLKTALQSWHKPDVQVQHQRTLRMVLNQLAYGQRESVVAIELAIKRVVMQCLEQLAKHSPDAANYLQRRHVDGQTQREAALDMSISKNQAKYLNTTAMRKLVELAFVEEQCERERHQALLRAKLPKATDGQLIGVDEICEQVMSQLAGHVHIAALVGIGGIGKTAICRRVVDKLIAKERFDDVVWLRVEAGGLAGYGVQAAESLSLDQLAGAILTQINDELDPESVTLETIHALREHLQRRSVLIVIDNLEQAGGADQVIDFLGGFLGVSKLLLTTRVRPAIRATVTPFTVPELHFSAASALMRQQARLAACHELATDDDTPRQSIYELVGGNPLAIKLVINLAAMLSLATVLDDLHKAEIDGIDDLYQRVYQQTWLSLSDEARALLTIMPISAEIGLTMTDIETATGMTVGTLSGAIQELIGRSLLDTYGTTFARRYGIHSLTRSFLLIDVLDWKLASSHS